MKENTSNQSQPTSIDINNYRLALVISILFQGSGLAFGLYILINNLRLDNAYLYYLVYPIIAIAFYRTFDDYFVLMSSKTERRFGLLFAFAFPQIFIVLETWNHYRMLSYTPLIIPSVLFGLVFSVVMLIKNKAFNLANTQDKFRAFGVAVLGLLLGFGFSLIYNFSGLKSQAVQYPVIFDHQYIETKQSKHGPYYLYHVVVKPWQYSPMTNDLEVNKTFYDNTDWNKPISVQVFTGKLNATWYVVCGFPESKTF